jgi:hypothetical protein
MAKEEDWPAGQASFLLVELLWIKAPILILVYLRLYPFPMRSHLQDHPAKA